MRSSSTRPLRWMPNSATTLLAAIAFSAFQASMRSRSVSTPASAMRLPVLSLAWHEAQCAANTGLPAAARVASIGNGYSGGGRFDRYRSEEHTSELQSLMRISYAVFCLKKKNNTEQKQPHN